jgi:hypothetical protein
VPEAVPRALDESTDGGVIDRGASDDLIVWELLRAAVLLGGGLLIVDVVGGPRLDVGHDGWHPISVALL